MNKFVIAAAIAILAVLAFFYWKPGADAPLSPETTPVQSADTAQSIAEDAASLDIGELDADFDSLNSDINSL